MLSKYIHFPALRHYLKHDVMLMVLLFLGLNRFLNIYKIAWSSIDGLRFHNFRTVHAIIALYTIHKMDN